MIPALTLTILILENGGLNGTGPGEVSYQKKFEDFVRNTVLNAQKKYMVSECTKHYRSLKNNFLKKWKKIEDLKFGYL